MKLKRAMIVAVIAALSLTVVRIGAAGAKAGSSIAAQEGMITNLHMSDSCDGPDMILFPAGTETVYVVFDYSDMQGEPHRIAVTDGVTLYDDTHSYTGSGTECITVTHIPGSIPPGTYRTQIYAGGLLPIKTKVWYVRPGGPGEIGNLYMSISPDGPPRTEFIEGAQTVWAVFDYANMEGNEVGIDVYEGDYRFYESPRISLTGSGTIAIRATHYLIAGFPAGPYRTHVMKDGFVDAVEDWSVLYGVYLPLVFKNQPYYPPCDPYEPNNAPPGWGPLVSDQNYQAKLCWEDSEDYYHFTITSLDNIVINLEVPATVDYHMWLYHESDIVNPVGSSAESGKGVDEHIDYTPTRVGRYYIRIRPRLAEDHDDVNSYTLVASFR